MEEVAVNKHGVNVKIKAHILSDEEMRAAGFHKNYYEGTVHEQECPYWYFYRTLKSDGKFTDIEFNVQIPKDGSDIRIDVLDMNFCQPYDYQYILDRNPKQKFALTIRDGVEKWMDYLQERGILSGHVRGEYI